MRFHQVLHGSFDGGRIEQRLPAGGSGGHDALDGGQEAHVEHAVGFVQHQDLDAGQVDQLAAQKIVQAAGSGDHHLRAFADGLQLRVFANPADHDGGADAGAVGDLGEGFMDLDGQFAGGAQDNGADAFGAGFREERLDERQDEREGLASAGLRRGHDIAARKRRLDGKLLHGCGLRESVLQEVGLEDGGESEFCETFHFSFVRKEICEPTTNEGRRGSGSTSSYI